MTTMAATEFDPEAEIGAKFRSIMVRAEKIQRPAKQWTPAYPFDNFMSTISAIKGHMRRLECSAILACPSRPTPKVIKGAKTQDLSVLTYDCMNALFYHVISLHVARDRDTDAAS